MNKILEPTVDHAGALESVLDDTQNLSEPRALSGRASYDSGAPDAHSDAMEPHGFVPGPGTNRFNLPKMQPMPGATGQATPQQQGGLLVRLRAAIGHKVKATLSDRGVLASALLLCGIVACSALGGFLLGQSQPARTAGFTIVPASFNAAGTQSIDDVVALGPADAQAAYVQKELTKQLGEMRAELLRLHTVFVQLAQLAELDDGEFDLQSPLLDWKEQSSLQQSGLLNRRIAHMSDYSGTMTRIFNTRRMAFDQKISGRPLVEGHRSSGFGFRADPITKERTEHQGLDYSGPVGEPILALADGVVTFSGKNAGYGNLVELQHVDGLRTRYAHNQLNLVSTGKAVKKGEPIATLGSTGRSTGPHVHIEVRLNGSPIDPGFFIR